MCQLSFEGQIVIDVRIEWLFMFIKQMDRKFYYFSHYNLATEPYNRGQMIRYLPDVQFHQMLHSSKYHLKSAIAHECVVSSLIESVISTAQNGRNSSESTQNGKTKMKGNCLWFELLWCAICPSELLTFRCLSFLFLIFNIKNIHVRLCRNLQHLSLSG